MAVDVDNHLKTEGPPLVEEERQMDASEVEAIVKKYDAESNFRNLSGITAKITGALCILLSLFHIYTAGYGLLNEIIHRTVHLTFVLFADWPLAIAAAGISLYLIVFFKQIFIVNIGFPQIEEYVMGLLAIIMVTEACRRVMGNTLPVIGGIAMVYGLLGPWLPEVLGHRGYDIVRIVEHLYLGTEGIYGVAVGVVATYVFHFVLFGVMAQASGLGQLFIDLAMILAGKYAGGPAKVSVVSSGFFGMISGSPIANTATTGSFTIPMMKKNGFSPEFASAVEASSSCGGQVTPPIMGASAFVMTEMLGIPYNGGYGLSALHG